ncbi:MAG TPA: hypothetical protein VG941_00920 [Candidatus Paceibacterota bacterium]|nr:hypothetical protein [Candidatus Paceibacterota bacterium]
MPHTLRSNVAITRIAARKAESLGDAPIFTQLDVQFDPSWNAKMTYCTETPGNPPPTLRIAREAARWAVENRIDELWISAALPHLWRCERDLRAAIREVGAESTVRICEEIRTVGDEEYWYMPDSTQPRVRFSKEWLKRERILLMMPYFLYKRVAS